MRSRDWRRFQQENIYRKRVKSFCRNWWYFRTANGDRVLDPLWYEFIGLRDFYLYKNNSTTRYDSRYKVKYSPNKSKGHYRDPKPKALSYGTREKDKVLVRKILNEYEYLRNTEQF